MDLADRLAFAPYDTYTPAMTASTTNPVCNTRVGHYRRDGRRVTGWLRCKWSAIGGGESLGSGAYRFQLPVAASADYQVFDSLGRAVYQDAGTRQYIGSADMVTSTTVQIDLEGGTGCTSAAPVTPANGDFYFVAFDYEAA